MSENSNLPPDLGAIKKKIVEKMGVVFDEVANEFNLSVDEVRNILASRPLRLTKVEHERREEGVCRLRQEGLSNGEIARKLGLSMAVVSQLAHKLIHLGRLDKRRPGRFVSEEESVKREQRIIQLRQQGCSNKEVASLVGLPYPCIIGIVAKLLAGGNIHRRHATGDDLISRKQQIILLYEKGLSQKKIAGELGLSIATINGTIGKLRGEGVLPPRSRGGYLSEEACREYEEKIIELRKLKYSDKKIASVLGISKILVSRLTIPLIKDGRISHRQKGIKRAAAWRDLGNDRTKMIVGMVRRCATLQDIGNALGVSRERARQLIKKISEEHGEHLFTSDKTFWTVPEAADELKTSASIISAICTAGEVSCRRRGTIIDRKKGTRLIDSDSLEVLRNHPRVTRQKVCVMCGATFITSNRRGLMCSDSCRDKRRLQTRYCNERPTPDRLHGWHMELYIRLQSHCLPEHENWLAIFEAQRRTDLSRMQLTYLRTRNIVTIRPHPAKTWGGKPVATYAASELAIAKEVWEEFQRQHPKKS